MIVFEGYENMLHFEVLPGFAKYILENHHIAFIQEQIRLLYKMKVPVLKYFTNWTEEQLIEYSKAGTTVYLTSLIENKAKEHIEKSIVKWLKDQLEIVGKYELAAEDISLIIFIRSRSLKKFVSCFTNDMNLAIKLGEEIDTFNLAENTSYSNTYINILKDKITREVNFNSLLANTSPGIVYVFDLEEQKFIYANNKTSQVLGYTEAELEGMAENLIEIITHPEDKTTLYSHLKCFNEINDNGVCTFECRLKHANGQYRWMRNYEAVFKRNAKGQPKQIIGTAYDISQEKRIMEDLERREIQLTEAQTLANLGSFEWNFLTKEENFTDQYYQILELGKGNVNRDFLVHIHPEDKDRFMRIYQGALKNGYLETEFRYVINGKEKYIWCRGLVSFNENKEPEKIIGTIQDISERRKIEQTLLQKTIELEKSNADLLEFTYVASHDLKEPLRKISLYSDMILSQNFESLDLKGKENFQKIRDSSRRMQNMIDDLLTLSSISAEKQKEVFSLQLILEDVLTMLEISIKEKNAVIRAENLPEAPIIPILFRQLFLNIIGNALKFSRKEVPPVITIVYHYLNRQKIIKNGHDSAAYLELCISDNGIGFKAESAEKIFLLFQRLHNKSDYDGTGLGLAICKRIVEEHNGTITASSQPGNGASFTITIPV